MWGMSACRDACPGIFQCAEAGLAAAPAASMAPLRTLRCGPALPATGYRLAGRPCLAATWGPTLRAPCVLEVYVCVPRYGR